MRQHKFILPTKKYFNAPDEELNTIIDLNSNQNTIRENERNIVLDVAEQYNKERNKSIKYKVYGKLKMVFNNDYLGSTNYEYLKNRLYLTNYGGETNYDGYLPYNEFAFLRNDILREKNIPKSGNTFQNFEQQIQLTTENTGHTTITDISAPYHNWNIYLSYIYTANTNYSMAYTLSGNTKYSFKSNDGIPFIAKTNGDYITLTSPIEHGISVGEYIILSGTNMTQAVDIKNKIFYIDKVGNELYNSEKYVLNISKRQLKNITITENTVYLGKRCLDIKNISGTTSSYYVHMHKTLTNADDYILDKLGFESSIWRDEKKLLFENFEGTNDFMVEKNKMESMLYDFKKPFYLSGITNNLGYTPTEIYVSIIFKNGNGFFNYPVKNGWRFNFHDTWIDQHFNGNSSLENTLPYSDFIKAQGSNYFYFRSGSTLDVGTVLTGAFVEYNDVEMKERIISESFHKLTIPTTIFDHNQDDNSSYSGASATNTYGLYYQPHYRVKLRQLSPYVETSKTNDVINLPENTKYYPIEKLWKWRDLYDHGYIDDEGNGTDYPYFNDIHYVKLDINFYLRNEKNYTNKKDGIKRFINNTIDC